MYNSIQQNSDCEVICPTSANVALKIGSMEVLSKPASCGSIRYLISLLASFTFFNAMTTRACINVAIVVMVNSTAASSENETSEECPRQDSNINATSHELGEFGWSADTQSQVLSVFYYGYIITQLPGGYLAERFGSKLILGWILLSSSILCAVSPLLARFDVRALIACRFLMGLCQGPLYPSIYALWGLWAPPLERTRLMTLSLSGSTIGDLVGIALTGILCSSHFLGGWPLPFYVFGGCSFICFVLWILFYNDPLQHRCLSEAERTYITTEIYGLRGQPTYSSPPWKSILTSRPFYGLLLFTTFDGMAYYIIFICGPTYMKQVLNFDISEDGLLNAAPYLAYLFSSIAAGPAADFIMTKRWLSVTTTRKAFTLTDMISSCDTFVALPPATADGCVVFGKNSDRPADEVQEVVYVPSTDHLPGTNVSCTYIDIPQVEHTYTVILSKPAWMWGAEMGANDCGVTIGNEAVWTHLTGHDGLKEKLIGMDYVRLGLERGATARQAMDVIVGLLKIHGQGGRCFENAEYAGVVYCNSFIIADRQEAWVLETAGQHWAAERVDSGVRNISNLLTIGTKIDAMSDGLPEIAQQKGYWDPADGPFDFALAFSTSPPVRKGLPAKGTADHRWAAGRKLLEKFSLTGKFDATSMFAILRDEDSCICRTDVSVSTGSQVSVLWPHGSANADIHWFTATPNPSRSIYKPFIFAKDVDIGTLTASPFYGDKDPVKEKPRFQRTVERRHTLYKAHENVPPLGPNPNARLLADLNSLEAKSIVTVRNLSDQNSAETRHLFRDAVQEELQVHRKYSKD